MSLQISVAIQNAMCDALVDRVDIGAGFAYIQLRTGDPPATPADGDSGLLLVSKTFNKPAFTPAGASGFQPAGQAAGLGVGTPEVIQNDGTAGHYRVFDSNNYCVWQGTVGTDLSQPDFEVGSADLDVADSDFQAGGTATIQSFLVFVPSQ